MKLLVALLLLPVDALHAQSIPSQVVGWQRAAVTRKAAIEQRVLLDGSTRDFRRFKLHATTLPPQQAPHPAHRHDDEELIIVKEGRLTVTIEGQAKTLGPGSVALILPGDEHGFQNAGDSSATYYVMRYEATIADAGRGGRAGGSFWVDFNDLVLTPHDKGGIRRYFDRPTAMTRRFEMHMTTLNPGLWSPTRPTPTGRRRYCC